jgi:hypothetical protein
MFDRLRVGDLVGLNVGASDGEVVNVSVGESVGPDVLGLSVGEIVTGHEST